MTGIELQPFNIYIGLAIVGIFTGLGNALGQYIVNKHIIKKIEAIKKRFTKMKKTDTL